MTLTFFVKTDEGIDLSCGSGRTVLLVRDGFMPFVRGFLLYVREIRQMLEGAVRSGSVPVLGPGGHCDDGTGLHLDSGLSPFLIPAVTAHAYEYLHLLVMDMPVVAASGLEGDIGKASSE